MTKRSSPLNLSDYLRRLPPAAIFDRLLREKTKSRKILSSSAIDKVYKNFIEKENLSSRFNSLSEDDKIMCALAYLGGRGGIVTPNKSAVGDDLALSFLVYVARDEDNTCFYCGFDDLAPYLSGHVAGLLVQCMKSQISIQPADIWPLRSLNDFTIILSLAERGELKKTQKGALVSGSANTLKKLLCGSKTGLAFNSAEADRTFIISMLLSYGIERGIIINEEKSYRTTHERISQWLEQPVKDRWEDFFGFTIEYSGAWRIDILNRIFCVSDTSWLSSAVFSKWGGCEALHTLNALHYTGYIEATRKGDDILFRRPAGKSLPPDADRRPSDTGGIIISPDFTALLPRESAPEIIYAFSCLGKFLQFDCIYKGLIEREAVHSSLSRGIGGDILLSYLKKWRSPDNVVATVGEWIREFSRLYVSQENIIVTFDDKTSLQIQSYDPVNSLVKKLNAHAVFTISKGKEGEVQTVLQSMGYDTRMPQKEILDKNEELNLGSQEEQCPLIPVLDFSEAEKQEERSILTGKYSSELKKLDINELIHVIDYAILMGYVVTFEYGGGQYVKKGRYSIRPISIDKNNNSKVEGEVLPTKKKKTFVLNRILKVGVDPS